MKKILVSNSVHTRPGQKNSKQNSKKIQKIKKLNSGFYLYQKRAERGWEREKKILVPNSICTRPGQENSEKNSKKVKKIKKLNSGIISMQKGLKEAEKEGKEF